MFSNRGFDYRKRTDSPAASENAPLREGVTAVGFTVQRPNRQKVSRQFFGKTRIDARDWHVPF